MHYGNYLGDFSKVPMNSLFLLWKPGQPRSQLSMAYIAIMNIPQSSWLSFPSCWLLLEVCLEAKLWPGAHFYLVMIPTFSSFILSFLGKGKLSSRGFQKESSSGLWWRLPCHWKYCIRPAVEKFRVWCNGGCREVGENKSHEGQF